jgi:hypothetical protein
MRFFGTTLLLFSTALAAPLQGQRTDRTDATISLDSKPLQARDAPLPATSELTQDIPDLITDQTEDQSLSRRAIIKGSAAQHPKTEVGPGSFNTGITRGNTPPPSPPPRSSKRSVQIEDQPLSRRAVIRGSAAQHPRPEVGPGSFNTGITRGNTPPPSPPPRAN